MFLRERPVQTRFASSSLSGLGQCFVQEMFRRNSRVFLQEHCGKLCSAKCLTWFIMQFFPLYININRLFDC